MTSSSEIEYVHQIIAEYKLFFELIYKVSKTNGASMNFNNCVKLATKTYVQFLCQDDFIKSPNHLKKVNASLVNSGKRWVVTGCRHFEDGLSEFNRRIYPRYSNDLARGVNTLGAPSVVMFYRDSFIPFDTRLNYMYDCDWYVRMCHNWGEPQIKRKDTIAIRIHENQSTNHVSGLLEAEIEITASNHTKSDSRSCICQVKESN
jgi:glycosyltransferase involved in cell wall biosynthesis